MPLLRLPCSLATASTPALARSTAAGRSQALTDAPVHAGDCFFLEKAWTAENAGASAIIIVDSVEEGLLTMSAPDERPEIAKLKADVTIPTALVQKAGLTLRALPAARMLLGPAAERPAGPAGPAASRHPGS